MGDTKQPQPDEKQPSEQVESPPVNETVGDLEVEDLTAAELKGGQTCYR